MAGQRVSVSACVASIAAGSDAGETEVPEDNSISYRKFEPMWLSWPPVAMQMLRAIFAVHIARFAFVFGQRMLLVSQL